MSAGPGRKTRLTLQINCRKNLQICIPVHHCTRRGVFIYLMTKEKLFTRLVWCKKCSIVKRRQNNLTFAEAANGG